MVIKTTLPRGLTLADVATQIAGRAKLDPSDLVQLPNTDSLVPDGAGGFKLGPPSANPSAGRALASAYSSIHTRTRST